MSAAIDASGCDARLSSCVEHDNSKFLEISHCCEAALRRFRALPAPSICDRVRIESGTLRDYKRLSEFHYRGAQPGAVTSVIGMTYPGVTVVGRFRGRSDEHPQLVGVLVRSLPQLSCRLRSHALCRRYSNLSPRDAAILLNREVRTISRVVIDPRWRGLGLAVKLVRHALANPEDGVCFTEALAAMGKVSPFFEHAGMKRYEQPLRARVEHARLLDVMEQLQIEPVTLASTDSMRNRVGAMSRAHRHWFEHELRRWHRAAHRTPRSEIDALSIKEILIAARNELLAQPVYYLFSHDRQERGDEPPVIPAHPQVIPAQAGIQKPHRTPLDSRLRGNDVTPHTSPALTTHCNPEPRMNRTFKILLLAFLITTILPGCRVGQSMRGEPMVGVALGEVSDSLQRGADEAAELIGAAGRFLPFPYDLLAGGAAIVLAQLFGQNRGCKRGWNDREQQQQRIDMAWEESAARSAVSCVNQPLTPPAAIAVHRSSPLHDKPQNV